MDGESFDRLSVLVHRLRDRATRRGALGLIVGGSLAAAGGLLADDAAAKNRNKNKNKNCKGYGGTCDHHGDCCGNNCRNGRCWYGGGGGGGGGNNCGGLNCPNGWRCCNQGGVRVCVPNTYPTCCNGNGYNYGYHCCSGYGGACPSGWECCGYNQCCSEGWKCCGNGRCCPRGWYCGNSVCYANQNAEISAQSVESVPFSDAVEIDDADWYEANPN